MSSSSSVEGSVPTAPTPPSGKTSSSSSTTTTSISSPRGHSRKGSVHTRPIVKSLQAVSFVLAAEFDIIKGGVVKHQFPRKTEMEELALAELMLPDGAHKYDTSWSFFFLNRKGELLKRLVGDSNGNGSSSTGNNHSGSSSSSLTGPLFPSSSSSSSTNPITAVTTSSSSTSSSSVNDKGSEVIPPPPVPPAPSSGSNSTIESRPTVPCAVFRCTDVVKGWVPLTKSSGYSSSSFHGAYFGAGKVVVTDSPLGGEVVMEIPFHVNLQYTRKETMFHVVFDKDGAAVGFKFADNAAESTFGLQAKEALAAHAASVAAFRSSVAPEMSRIVSTGEGLVSSEDEEPFLYCLNIVRTQKDASAARGAVVRSLAIATRYQFFHVFKPVLAEAMNVYFANPTQATVSELFTALNRVSLEGAPVISEALKIVKRLGVDRNIPELWPVSLTYRGDVYPLEIPLALFEDEIAGLNVSGFVKKYGPDTMQIYSALLSQRRVLFVGYNNTAEEVCLDVLTAVALVAPPLRGFLRRVFPYTSLNNIDFLEVPGYVAGVTNPVFEQRPAWWDVAVDVGTGKVKVNSMTGTRGVSDDDKAFWVSLQEQVKAGGTEADVKAAFHEHTAKFLDLVFGEGEFPDEESEKRALAVNHGRVETFRDTIAYLAVSEARTSAKERSAIRGADVWAHVRRLRAQPNLGETETMRILDDFLRVISTEDECIEFMSLFPESRGGLYPVAMRLFHGKTEVRLKTVALLRRLDTLKAGQGLISGMNLFLVLAYERTLRLLRSREAAAGRVRRKMSTASATSAGTAAARRVARARKSGAQ